MKSEILSPSTKEALPDFNTACLVVYKEIYSSAMYVVLVNPEEKGSSISNFSGTIVYSEHAGHKVGTYLNQFVKSAFKLYRDRIALEN